MARSRFDLPTRTRTTTAGVMIVLGLALGLAVSATPARATTYDQALAAFRASSFAVARAGFAPLAAKGDPVAQYYLGLLYRDGLGVRGDPAVAMRWLGSAATAGLARAQYALGQLYMADRPGAPKNMRRGVGWIAAAARKGFAEARYRLGMMYRKGTGVPQDQIRAAAYLRRAADQGLAKAQFELGVQYWNGRGVPQNFARAAAWTRRAAEQGFIAAQLSLGYMYAAGKGVKRDFVAAHQWFNLAAVGGNKEALRGRAEVAAKMKPAMIARAQRLAANWKPRVSESAARP